MMLVGLVGLEVGEVQGFKGSEVEGREPIYKEVIGNR